MKLADRVAALEARVTALEGRSAAEAPAAEGELWVLEGLRARHPEPGAVVLAGSVRLPDDRALEWQEGLETQALLDRDWAETADLLGALGHPVRLALLQRFLGGATTAAEAGTGTTGQIYHHLRQLVAAGWLRSVGGGRYEVPPQRVVPLMSIVMGAHR
ncbi:helix-turn-helix domain-containing protein [Nocardioides sp. YIM 152315]|uniref:ArsR/SmtB family transcription factor n=1 Tax=Nocardioides sp. YIM 152315 TaxID=3031760 RepID=UPI0023DC533B|nr:helix-turn-helix domain-containing protein [Nocardioides sp. YIM 152315]MDF1604965.1 helix-turn-helix domain-containing protein [Nocardioides sp. YIM 152315]